MDLYRLDSFEEIDGLGLEDYLFEDGLCVIEWADKARGYFPVDHVDISIETVSESARAFTIEAGDDGRERLFSALNDLKERV